MAASAVALGALALSALQSEGQATGRGGGAGQSQHQLCFWYKQRAMSTGDEHWWYRWRRCIRNHEI
jgi:hypothetical protein